jgi:hypothetical protein
VIPRMIAAALCKEKGRGLAQSHDVKSTHLGVRTKRRFKPLAFVQNQTGADIAMSVSSVASIATNNVLFADVFVS